MNPRRAPLLGSLCIAGGLAVVVSGFLLDSQAAGPIGSSTADTTLARLANALFAAAVLGLIAGVLGLRLLRAGGSGWLPRIGTGLALLGLVLWMVGGLYETTQPSAEDPFTPAGGLISSLGMVVLGVAVVRAGVLARWRRLTPLLVGLWFFVQLPVQVVFFLSVGGSPFFALLLGVVGALWALVGHAVRSTASELVAG